MCEGYTDVIAFFVAGMPRAVATCGTALGEEHFRLLRNFARRVVLAYDADAAGQEGAGRVYEWERHHEVDVAVAALPAGADPADLARDNPAALARRHRRGQAVPLLPGRPCLGVGRSALGRGEGQGGRGRRGRGIGAPQRAGARPVPDARGRPVPPRARRSAGPGDPSGRPAPDLPGADQRVAPRTPGRPRGRARRSRGAVPRHRGQREVRGLAPGLEALRLAVHRPERVGDRLESVLFPDELQRAAFVALTESDDLHQAVEAADDDDPRVAGLLRRLAVEEPATDADDVVVTLVRNASRRALAVAEAQVRLSPNTVGEIAPVIARVRHDLDELDDPERCLVSRGPVASLARRKGRHE